MWLDLTINIGIIVAQSLLTLVALLIFIAFMLYADYPHFAQPDVLEPVNTAAITALARLNGKVKKFPISHAAMDYYLTNSIARASKISALTQRGKTVAAE
jgi:hypothetical protein